MGENLILTNVRPMGGDLTSVTFAEGRIAGYGEVGSDGRRDP